LEKVVPDCGPSIFAAGMVYNAISRVRKLEDLILLDFDPGAFKQRKNVDKEIQRLQNMKPFTPLPVIDRPSLTDLLPISEAVEPLQILEFQALVEDEKASKLEAEVEVEEARDYQINDPDDDNGEDVMNL